MPFIADGLIAGICIATLSSKFCMGCGFYAGIDCYINIKDLGWRMEASYQGKLTRLFQGKKDFWTWPMPGRDHRWQSWQCSLYLTWYEIYSGQ
ncbi:hypothetical protein CEK25_002884 [Fusarium fujikuroi]|nr:hypothetical protein CEK25_002884 [Fusarium fujikuroi]